MVEELFPDVRRERKSKFKEMSKRELAEKMFGAGVFIGSSNSIKLMSKAQEKETLEKKEN